MTRSWAGCDGLAGLVGWLVGLDAIARQAWGDGWTKASLTRSSFLGSIPQDVPVHVCTCVLVCPAGAFLVVESGGG